MMNVLLRKPPLASLLFSCSILACAACGGSETKDAELSDDAAVPSGEDDAAVPPEGDDVVLKISALYGFADDKPSEKIDASGVSATILASVNGKETRFEPTTREDGALVFVGVPRAPYVLDLRTTSRDAPAYDPPHIRRYPIDGLRNLVFGDRYWARQDVTPLSEDTQLALSLSVPEGIAEDDTFSWVSLRSYFYRSATFVSDSEDGVTNAPAPDATSSKDWTFADVALMRPYGDEASGLPVAAKKDDLIVLQSRAEVLDALAPTGDVLDAFRPWSRATYDRVIGLLTVPSPDFANGKTNTVSGKLTAPATERLSLSLEGEPYAEIRGKARYPAATTSRASIALSHEAGDGPEVYTSVGVEAWSLAAQGRRKPLDLSCYQFPEPCYPGEGCVPALPVCDPGSCEIGCGNVAMTYEDPGDLSAYEFDAPRVYAAGMRDFFTLTYRFNTQVALPSGHFRMLSASVYESRPRTSSKPYFRLAIAAPTEVALNGTPLVWPEEGSADFVSIAEDDAPTVTFSHEGLGGLGFFAIELIDLMPDSGKALEEERNSLTVATLYTHEKQVKLPRDSLRSGHVYYLRVTAAQEGWKFGERAPRETLLRTAVFTAPFVFGAQK